MNLATDYGIQWTKRFLEAGMLYSLNTKPWKMQNKKNPKLKVTRNPNLNSSATVHDNSMEDTVNKNVIAGTSEDHVSSSNID